MERLDPKTQTVGQRVEVNALHPAICRHSLGWLVAANAIGLLLAALLLWPELNNPLAPLTYGRWVPLHLNWQLYGWCALPLVGVLCRFYLPHDARGNFAARLALGGWTGALLYGGITWLVGQTSGKLFLDWTGPARLVWALALLILWLVLVTQHRREPGPWWARVLLVALFPVPFLLYWAAGPAVYPPVNPDSGGATGASLLGSTLGVLGIFGLLPWLLRLTPRGGPRPRQVFAAAFVLTLSFYAGLNHGPASHHHLDQIVGLGLLLPWIPLVWSYARSFVWATDSHRWLAAAFVWWALLVLTGLLTFLPGISERLKFTNALVAHSHLAMAGLVTSLHLAILLNLGRSRPLRPWTFWAWQLGCGVQVAVLLWLGWQEGTDSLLLSVRGGLADGCYGLRFLAGGVMLAASCGWWRDLGRKFHEPQQT